MGFIGEIWGLLVIKVGFSFFFFLKFLPYGLSGLSHESQMKLVACLSQETLWLCSVPSESFPGDQVRGLGNGTFHTLLIREERNWEVKDFWMKDL